MNESSDSGDEEKLKEDYSNKNGSLRRQYCRTIATEQIH